MLLFLSLTGFFLSFLLLYFNVKKYPATIYLSVFFLLTSLYGFVQAVILYSNSVDFIASVYLNFTSVLFLIGPMLFFYVRSVLRDDHKLKRIDLIHFVPAMVLFVASIPHFFSPWSEKLEVAKLIIQDRNYIWRENFLLVNYVFPKIVNFLGRTILLIFYTCWSFVLLIRYRKEKDKQLLITKPNYSLTWLYVLLFMTFIVSFLQTIMIYRVWEIEVIEIYTSRDILQIVSLLALITMLILPYFNPHILYGLPRVPEKRKEKLTQNMEADKRALGFVKSGFDITYIKKIEKKVNEFMFTAKPYLNQDCNISNFSKQIGVPTHHLAYYFREVKEQTFNDFRNETRVNHAARLIDEGKENEFTIEAIGLMSGFSSKSTFFVSFKKFKGTPPGLYSPHRH